MRINYSIVDVFSEGKYTGNPLAVFKNAGNISDCEMLQIAKEINYSETTFIMSDVGGKVEKIAQGEWFL